MVSIVTCRGISESMSRNTLSGVIDHFPDTRHIELGWSATYGLVNQKGNLLGHSYKQALEYGQVLLRQTLDTSPDGVILLGYSGGAALAGNVASFGHPNLVAVGLVADPFAPQRDGKWGLSGKRNRPISVPAIWKSDEKDVICRARPNARLRQFADASEAFSLGDPAAWTHDLVDRLITNRWQAIVRNPFDIPRLWADFAADISDAEGYLFRGDHTSYGVRREANGNTYIENLAIWVAQQKHLHERRVA